MLRSKVRLVLFCTALTLTVSCAWFRDFDFAEGRRRTGGNPEIGRERIKQYACHSCHTIPGIPGSGTQAPSLAHWPKRAVFADQFRNTPENLMSWIQNPKKMKPRTSMPNLGVTGEDSRHMAAYLYSVH